MRRIVHTTERSRRLHWLPIAFKLDRPNMSVITATTRLARELRQEYDREQEAAVTLPPKTSPV